MGCSAPKFYGFPKIHKLGIPLRPIVSSCGSVTYGVAKVLTKILKPLVGKSSHHVHSKFWWPFKWFGRRFRPFKLAEPSLSSVPHEGGPDVEEAVTVAHILDCPTITVHTRKCYKALIDSVAAISLIRYSTYQRINNSFKMLIQPTTAKLNTADSLLMTAKLNTADSLLMTALGMTALHLRISDFKFTHNLVLCNRLPDTEIIFKIDIQKKFSISYAWDKDKNCYIQKEGKFLMYTRNYEQKATICVVKLALKILPQHNGVVPIKITGQAIKEHMAYFITDEDLKKEGTLILTSPMASTASKEKHLLMFWCLITQTNTLNLTNENT